jgi:hypothetical protein
LDPTTVGNLTSLLCEDTLCRYFCSALLEEAVAAAEAGEAGAAAAAPPEAVPAAGVATLATAGAAALAVAAVAGWTPMTCSSDCNMLLNRFCCVPAGTGVIASPSESLLVDVDSTREPFLWPCVWAVMEESAEGAELKLAMDDIGVSLIEASRADSRAQNGERGSRRQ